MKQIVTATAAALLLLLLLLLLPDSALAQDTGSITGTVTDAESGETIPGVNVSIPELNIGAATDVDGEYTIEGVPAGTHTLSVSFVGYQTNEAEVTVSAGETVTQDFEMQTTAVGLDEVVVTGYGTQRRADITGSVASVSVEEIEDVPVQSTSALLQGRAAGVTVNTTSGGPGGGFRVNVRGEGSINADDEPLYIVDGVPISFNQESELTDRNPLNAINPNDIESIEVLKDAASAAIYGAQAANGVVLITTKSGSAGETQVSLSFEGGTRFQSDRFDLMERDEWVDFQVDAFGEEGFREDILPTFGYDPDTPFNELRNFDWQDWLFQPGSHMKAGFTATGGDENTQFYLSGSWGSTEGATRRVSYDQLNFRTRLSQQFGEDLNLDASITLNNEDNRGVCEDGFFINCPFYQAIGEEPPISFPYLDGPLPEGFLAEADGSYNPFTEQSPTTNPALFLNEEDRTVDVTQILTSFRPSYNITDWLTARGTLGLDYQYTKENEYGTPTLAPSEGGELSRRFATLTNVTANATLEARQTFGDHHDVDALVVGEFRREYWEDDETGYIGFNNELLQVPAAANEVSFFQGFNTEYRLISYVGRLDYNYDNRYLLVLTGRYDGHSRFGTGNRWGFFPSASVGWRISEEPFFNVDFVDNLKLRAGYGVTGNAGIGNFAARGLYDISGSYQGQVGFEPDQLVNPELSWEESRGANLGADWSLWRGRLTGSLNLYREVSDNLLLDRPIPSESGFEIFTENIGKIENRGIEFDFRSVNIQTDDFQWSTRFNIGVNQNEILELSEGVDELFAGDAVPFAVGHSLRAWKVPLWAGVNPADGRPLYYDADGNLTYDPDNADDQFFDGLEEDVAGGFGTRFDYKGVSLDLFFNFSYGVTGLPNTQRTWTAAFGEGVLGLIADERWREPGDIATFPRAVPFNIFDNTLDPDALSSRWLFNANYIRLRNATLSYRIPPSLMNVVGLRGARIYATGVNLITWSTYLGIDPELSFVDDGLEGDAFEESSYPAEQQINIGIELDL